MRIVFSFFLVLIACTSYAQQEANYWYFGQNAGLDFSTSPPTSISGELKTYEGCSTISDKAGNLLFYSDGKTVWNRENNVMTFSNGMSSFNNLLGDPSSTQSALVIPKPGNGSIYYLFTVGARPFRGLNYYTIDMSKNNGFGEITDGPIDLSGTASGNWSEKVTAVAGEDCDTFWVISADKLNFYSYKIDVNGVNSTPVKSSFDRPIETTRGSVKISPDGKHVVLANQSDATFLYEFNALDGTISNQRNLDIPREIWNGGYGIAFSETSKTLYISNGVWSLNDNEPEQASIYQFNLNNASISDINSSRKTILSETGFRGALQLGVDGKIYYARSRKSHLGVINFPDKIGAACKYEFDGVQLAAGTTSSEGLPPFIQSFFSPVKIVDSETQTINFTTGTTEICIGESLNIEPELEGTADSTFEWTKDDDPTVLFTTRNITIDQSNFGSGTYNLTMNIIDDCGRSNLYNGTVVVAFIPVPELFAVPVYEQCDFDDNPTDGIAAFNLESKIDALTASAEGLSIEFFEASDTTFSSPIVNPSNYRNSISTNSGSHKIIVRATNSASCATRGELDLKAKATPLDAYPDVYLTESDLNAGDSNARNSIGSNNASYDFSEKTKAIIANSGGAFSSGTHTFAYYNNSLDATLEINEITVPFDNVSFNNNTRVFVRIGANGISGCSDVGEFKIFINQRPVPEGNTAPEYLCVNNPIDNPQNITIDLNADTGTDTDTYQWYLNGNEITGATSAIHKANVEGAYKVEAYRAYENNIDDLTDDSMTIGYNTFDVIESNKALIVSTNITDNLDNPEANILNINIEGIGDYEYALNSTSLADFTKGSENLSFTFNDVKPGLNTVYIRDVNGCGTAESQQLSFLFFQRHFTPNNDGVYDTWKILGSNTTFYSATRVEIFDRYGKVVGLITDVNSSGWNGTNNGEKLPSNDYWFNAVLEDINGNIRKETGHFSLLRK